VGAAIAAAILTGGRSRRMGSDKAFAEVGGVAMVARVASVLRSSGCAPVAAVGGDAERLQAAGLEVVVDDHPGEGPLGGIITALRWQRDVPVLVVACDLPLLTDAAVTALVSASTRSSVDVVVAATSRLEPLFAVWHASALSVLEAAFAGGERAVHRAIGRVDSLRVQLPAETMWNVNEPSEIPPM
jgi:molybdenum cofactor guanylyltransferase